MSAHVRNQLINIKIIDQAIQGLVYFLWILEYNQQNTIFC